MSLGSFLASCNLLDPERSWLAAVSAPPRAYWESPSVRPGTISGRACPHDSILRAALGPAGVIAPDTRAPLML